MNPQDIGAIHWQRMSPGDRSCVAAMLQRPGASQMTAAGSAHCSFYEGLADAGWAARDTTSSLAAVAPSVRVWRLTDLGRARLPALLAAWKDAAGPAGG